MAVNFAVIYYSSTGTTYQLARAAADGAKEAGAEVRFLKVKEIAPQSAIQRNDAWQQHVNATSDVPDSQHGRSRMGGCLYARHADALRAGLVAAQAVHGPGRPPLAARRADQ